MIKINRYIKKGMSLFSMNISGIEVRGDTKAGWTMIDVYLHEK